MSLLKMSELRAMNKDELEDTLKQIKADLMQERGLASMGGAPPNPGKLKSLRKNIARILTIQSEREAKN